jgi:hypothetical protein
VVVQSVQAQMKFLLEDWTDHDSPAFCTKCCWRLHRLHTSATTHRPRGHEGNVGGGKGEAVRPTSGRPEYSLSANAGDLWAGKVIMVGLAAIGRRRGSSGVAQYPRSCALPYHHPNTVTHWCARCRAVDAARIVRRVTEGNGAPRTSLGWRAVITYQWC